MSQLRKPPIVLFAAAALALGLAHAWRGSSGGSQDSVVLLVHGMTLDRESGTHSWGRPIGLSDGGYEWTGMIGRLEREGLPFGGVIRPRGPELRLPESLDTMGVAAGSGPPRVYCLEFSSAANTDGLSYKAIELSRCIRVLGEHTGCARVKVVAHSAGGVAARAYLQGAIPEVPYRGDVDRLITIGTPHLGAAIASTVGDLLGTRATSLKPDAELIHTLNRLDLPSDVRFASIVVRGIGVDLHGSGDSYSGLADTQTFLGLPVDFQQGGDQVVHVISQNLRLARCARRYEEGTGRPVQSVLCRVPAPEGGLLSLSGSVHGRSTSDPDVQETVVRLLSSDDLWDGLDAKAVAAWERRQAGQCAYSAIEEAVLQRHPLVEVAGVEIEGIEPVEPDGDVLQYRFTGTARCRVKFVGRLAERLTPHGGTSFTRVEGRLRMTFDRFSRVTGCASRMTHIVDRY